MQFLILFPIIFMLENDLINGLRLHCYDILDEGFDISSPIGDFSTSTESSNDSSTTSTEEGNSEAGNSEEGTNSEEGNSEGDSPSRQSSTSSTSSTVSSVKDDEEWEQLQRDLNPNTYKPPAERESEDSKEDNSGSGNKSNFFSTKISQFTSWIRGNDAEDRDSISNKPFPNEDHLTPEQRATNRSIFDKKKQDDEQKKEEQHNAALRVISNVANQQRSDDPSNPGGAVDGALEEKFSQLPQEIRDTGAKGRDFLVANVLPGAATTAFGVGACVMKVTGGACKGYKAEDEKNANNNSSTNATSTPPQEDEEYKMPASLPDMNGKAVQKSSGGSVVVFKPDEAALGQARKAGKEFVKEQFEENLEKIGEHAGRSLHRFEHGNANLLPEGEFSSA